MFFYNLIQRKWRRIHAEGRQSIYSTEENVKDLELWENRWTGISVSDVSAGMTLLKETVPDCLHSIVDYFDNTCVSGGFLAVRGTNGNIRFCRTPARFQLETWDVHNPWPRTSNIGESWNNSFRFLISNNNLSLLTVITSLQKDNCLVETEIERSSNYELSTIKRSRKLSVEDQKWLKTLCTLYVKGVRNMEQFFSSNRGLYKTRNMQMGNNQS